MTAGRVRRTPCVYGTVALLGAAAMLVVPVALDAQQGTARISEETRILTTYPFADPNPVPILASDTRLYPYHRFEGYAHDAEPREWKVIHLENDWIEVWVLPEVGGKVWGARVKETGHEFIYRNEVMKFRNIALRGPWTSGGIEFNFGVIGHTPATATPVDYLTRENDDGSVSVFVGAMDLPSRTNWRVEVRLPADRAYFETNAQWQNPTPLEQPYYNWMTGAAFAQDDLVLSIPGNAYLEHPGAERAWPIDLEGRRLPVYDENRFGGNKSYHVVGELNDFFGGYYLDDDYGFGHWSRYEEMPGQKLWLWALSRQGGIWEDLLTDTDGQYVEFQAGRLLVQYSPEVDVNPISQVGFDPGASDRWTETWFPVEGLGGLTDASRDGAMYVERDGDSLRVRAHAFGTLSDVVQVTVDGTLLEEIPVDFETLTPLEHEVRIPVMGEVEVRLPRLGLEYFSDPSALALARPFTTDDEAMPSIPPVDRRVMAASELAQGRRLGQAREVYASVLADEPWNRDALLGMADLEYRRGLYADGLVHADRALRLDAYDAKANFVAGVLHRALGHRIDAREALGWAARSMAHRSASYVQLAELWLGDFEGDEPIDGTPSAAPLVEATRFARLALDYDRYSLQARRVLAVTARLVGDGAEAERVLAEIEAIDPLHHFVAAERYLADPDRGTAAALLDRLRGEYPEQELLELAIAYEAWNRAGDGAGILRLGDDLGSRPVLDAWLAHLSGDWTGLEGGADLSLTFPYRAESLPVLSEASQRWDHWSWTYLQALNLWGRDRGFESARAMESLGDEPDFAPFYVARAALAALPAADPTAASGSMASAVSIDREADLRRAVQLAPGQRTIHVPLIQYLQGERRWEDALAASTEARSLFPDDFDVALLHATSLNETLRFAESIDILDEIAVLPSEHSSAAHGLFAAAHTMAGFDALERSDAGEAAEHFEQAMTWPERLGQGRPYEPEERLQRYLLAVAWLEDGDEVAARTAWEQVVAMTPGSVFEGGAVARLDLLAAVALDALGRSTELSTFGDGQEGAMARLVSAVRRASGEGGGVASALSEAATGAMGLFADVEGKLLYRALMLEPGQDEPGRQ